MKTLEARAIEDFNRLAVEEGKNLGRVPLADGVRFRSTLIVAQALIIGLTCISYAIREHADAVRGAGKP